MEPAFKSDDRVEQFKKALKSGDAGRASQLLRDPELKPKLIEMMASLDPPIITQARSREMFDVLQAAGADINAKSNWWAGGFGFLHTATPELAAYAIERGAIVDVHAAARLGKLDKLREFISADPELVHARGGDGQTPMHFAATVEIASYLLDHGADMEARDVDHESTPAQYMVRDRQDVARFLIRRGCQTDILMAAALGDIDLVRKHLDAAPSCIRLRVSEEFFPMVGGRAGGTIYQWTLGWYVSAHQVAKKLGHQEIFNLLMERSPADLQLLTACWLGDETRVKALTATHPDLAADLSVADRRQLAHAARNNDLTALRLMLEAGLPVDGRSQHNGTPLHWAAFHGNRAMTELILRCHPPLEVADDDYHAPPLGWAIHGSEHGWFCKSGDYAGTVDALLQAGAKLPKEVEGSEAVQTLLRRCGMEQGCAQTIT